MDGQRRIARSLRRFWRNRKVRAFLAFGNHTRVRVAARGLSVCFLFGAVGLGLINGGHLDSGNSPRTLGDRFSSAIGMAADDIAISGVVQHQPEQLLQILGVRPGSSLIGFDAETARQLLQGIDWVAEASIQRKFPNQLEISVRERVPFAIWQRGNVHYIIDRDGFAISGLDAAAFRQLPLVTGEGANKEALQLIKHLKTAENIAYHILAAARVGERRWTLYLDNGMKILLPENDPDIALQNLSAAEEKYKLLAMGIGEIDMRVPGQMRVSLLGDEVASISPVQKEAKEQQ